jgi:hypothetical protein
MQGDGICCEYGKGQISVSAHRSSTISSSQTQTQLLAQSDGQFEYRLALDFTVPPLDSDTWTNDGDTGDDNFASTALIWAAAIILPMTIVSVMLVLLRPYPCF